MDIVGYQITYKAHIEGVSGEMSNAGNFKTCQFWVSSLSNE